VDLIGNGIGLLPAAPGGRCLCAVQAHQPVGVLDGVALPRTGWIEEVLRDARASIVCRAQEHGRCGAQQFVKTA
ncbi:MAG: hypothetical protein KJ740_22215, partial [Gammaproteobacteria bacterium]|nr:hypothetical protein [Gammaproteobacteria bacterium]